MRMENLKILLTFGIILIVPVVLVPQFFIGLLILIAVSYTHLDVYKRQLSCRLLIRLSKWGFWIMTALMT